MKRKIIINSLFGLVTLILLISVILLVYVKPWIGKRIETVLNEKSKDFTVKIGEVKIWIFKPGIELKKITILPRDTINGDRYFIKGEITTIKLKGISLMKVLIKNDIVISKVIISACNISAKVPFSENPLPAILSPYNIEIGSISLDKINLTIKNTLNTKSYVVKEGDLNLYELHFKKQDTISLSIIKQFDFKAKEYISVSADSLYTYKINGIIFSTTSNTLWAKKFNIQPNYNDYDFTSKSKYQTNRIEAEFNNVYAYDFSASNFFRSKNLLCSYIKIEKMDLDIFRDKRKPFHHIKKAIFQDIIYNYPEIINIDSIGLLKGNIAFTVHAEKANTSGRISFNEIHARIYKITNDTIYKAKNDYLELNADALLMGKGKLTVVLKSKLFDKQNTFTVNGALSSMETNDLNPILEKTAFIYASGKIDAMNFNFKANNTKSTGELTMLYHGLNIAFKNKVTNDTTAFAEKFISAIANSILLDSNPTQGEKVRVGIIDYERDPERFLFNYCFKSILSGIETSLVKRSKKSEELVKNTSVLRQ